MSDAILGEIRLFAGVTAPKNWAFCDGSLLDINANQALFSIIGVTYGGNGVQNFALPDMRGRVIVGSGVGSGGANYQLGSSAGSETVHLHPSAVPVHNHALLASSQPANSLSPGGASYGTTANNVLLYPDSSKPVVPDRYFSKDALLPSGGSPVPEPHDNMMPSCAINFMIAVEGIYPSY